MLEYRAISFPYKADIFSYIHHSAIYSSQSRWDQFASSFGVDLGWGGYFYIFMSQCWTPKEGWV